MQVTTLRDMWFKLSGLNVVGPLISRHDDRYALHQRLQHFIPGAIHKEYEELVLMLTTWLDDAELQVKTLRDMWLKLSGLDVVGPLISRHDDRHALHLRLKNFIPGAIDKEYEELVRMLTTLLEETRDSSDDDGNRSSAAGKYEGQSEGYPNNRAASKEETYNASKIDKLAASLMAMERTMSLLARTRVLPAEFIKSEKEYIKNEKDEKTSSPIEVLSGSDDDQSERNFDRASRRHLSHQESSDTDISDLRHERSASTHGVKKEPAKQRNRSKSGGRPQRRSHYTKNKQRRDTSFKNWDCGMKRQATATKIQDDINEATADNLPQILENMRALGFGLIRNYKKIAISPGVPIDDSSSDEDQSLSEPRFKSVFSEGNEPDMEQAYYHETSGWNATKSSKAPSHDVIFEGVQINSRDYEFKTRISRVDRDDTSGRETRKIMAPKSKALAAYNEKYAGQMRDIITGMFANEVKTPGCDPSNPNSWRLAQNVVWGGTGHQHPHCDQGKAGCFANEQIFPFACIHGFGLHQFAMWLLPMKKKRKYGFPYRFPKNALLFFRGDVPHAGAFSQLSRGHLEFFPTKSAGWTQTPYPYWGSNETMAKWQDKKIVFLIPDMRTFPFAFPHVTEEDENGNQIVTYPVSNTQEAFPHLDDNFQKTKTPSDAEQYRNNPGTGKRKREEEPKTGRMNKGRRKQK
jgi:hypothetical protein